MGGRGGVVVGDMVRVEKGGVLKREKIVRGLVVSGSVMVSVVGGVVGVGMRVDLG